MGREVILLQKLGSSIDTAQENDKGKERISVFGQRVSKVSLMRVVDGFRMNLGVDYYGFLNRMYFRGEFLFLPVLLSLIPLQSPISTIPPSLGFGVGVERAKIMS